MLLSKVLFKTLKKWKLVTGMMAILFPCLGQAQPDSILLFVAYEDTYYSEFIVMYEALVAEGYFVDVRSAGSGTATTYTIGGDLQAQANGLPGSSYADFAAQFQAMFGSPWNAGLNTVPASITLNGSIQSITTVEPYQALVVAGGTGATEYRIDGNYQSQGSLSAVQVQAAAEKLNELAVDMLLAGKPIMGQCHGASVPAYWRVPNTIPAGFDNLGHSLLEGSIATGYPEAATSNNLGDLLIEFRSEDKVVVGTPHVLLDDENMGAYRIITTRDWYPQTIAHAAQTLINMLESYPDASQMEIPASVVIIHGGEIDLSNCGAGNQNNDIPCNYGINPASNIPADFTDLVALLTSTEFSDSFNFVVSDVDLFGTTPFNLNNREDILNYLNNYDVVFFYKHWSNNVTDDLQNAIVDFADGGGGVVSIHHGLYNQSKNILVDSLFQAHSPANTWSANRTNYQIYQTNYGHFVSTFHIINDTATDAPALWGTHPLLPGSNLSQSLYPRFGIFDELYNNMQFVADVSFGPGVNQVNPIFSNGQTPGGQCHVQGFVKLFDRSEDETIGRVVYGEAGETIANYQYPHPYAQFLRNAVYWAAENRTCNHSISTWTSGTGTWDLSSNWSSNALPTICSDVIIPDQGTAISVTCPAMHDISIHLLEVGLNVDLEIPLGSTLTVTSN